MSGTIPQQTKPDMSLEKEEKQSGDHQGLSTGAKVVKTIFLVSIWICLVSTLEFTIHVITSWELQSMIYRNEQSVKSFQTCTIFLKRLKINTAYTRVIQKIRRLFQ